MSMYSRILYGVLLAVAIGLLVQQPRLAVAQSERLIQEMNLAPAKTQLRLAPGERWDGNIKVAVQTSQGATVQAQPVDFRSRSDEGGVPEFFMPEAGQQVGILSRWIAVEPDPVVLESGVYRDFPVSITIPRNAAAGGYYGAVLFQVQPGTGGGQQTISTLEQTIAALLIVEVEGETSQLAKLLAFTFDQDVFQTLPATGSLHLENAGNTHLAPMGVIEIVNELGFVVRQIELNPEEQLVLPQDTRRFPVQWGEGRPLFGIGDYELPLGDPFAFGFYRARLTLWYGQDGRVIEAGERFFVFPWQMLLLTITVLYLATRSIGWLWYRYKLNVVLGRRLRFGEIKDDTDKGKTDAVPSAKNQAGDGAGDSPSTS